MRLSRHAVEVLTPPLPDRNAALASQDQQLIDALTATFFIDKKLEGLATAAQPFTDRIYPINIVSHEEISIFPAM
jgi:hypothetical protein